METGELRSYRVRNSIRIEELSLPGLGNAPEIVPEQPAVAPAVAGRSALAVVRPGSALLALEAWAAVMV